MLIVLGRECFLSSSDVSRNGGAGAEGDCERSRREAPFLILAVLWMKIFTHAKVTEIRRK